MRSIIFALLVAICCMVIYTNAAALPDNSSESKDIAEPQQFEDFDENEGS